MDTVSSTPTNMENTFKTIYKDKFQKFMNWKPAATNSSFDMTGDLQPASIPTLSSGTEFSPLPIKVLSPTYLGNKYLNIFFKILMIAIFIILLLQAVGFFDGPRFTCSAGISDPVFGDANVKTRAMSEFTHEEHLTEDATIVMFHADWCGFCKQQKPDYDKHFEDKATDLKMMACEKKNLHEKSKMHSTLKGFPTYGFFIKRELVDLHVGAFPNAQAMLDKFKTWEKMK